MKKIMIIALILITILYVIVELRLNNLHDNQMFIYDSLIKVMENQNFIMDRMIEEKENQ